MQQRYEGTKVQRYNDTCHPGTFGGCPSFSGPSSPRGNRPIGYYTTYGQLTV